MNRQLRNKCYENNVEEKIGVTGSEDAGDGKKNSVFKKLQKERILESFVKRFVNLKLSRI